MCTSVSIQRQSEHLKKEKELVFKYHAWSGGVPAKPGPAQNQNHGPVWLRRFVRPYFADRNNLTKLVSGNKGILVVLWIFQRSNTKGDEFYFIFQHSSYSLNFKPASFF